MQMVQVMAQNNCLDEQARAAEKRTSDVLVTKKDAFKP